MFCDADTDSQSCVTEQVRLPLPRLRAQVLLVGAGDHGAQGGDGAGGGDARAVGPRRPGSERHARHPARAAAALQAGALLVRGAGSAGDHLSRLLVFVPARRDGVLDAGCEAPGSRQPRRCQRAGRHCQSDAHASHHGVERVHLRAGRPARAGTPVSRRLRLALRQARGVEDEAAPGEGGREAPRTLVPREPGVSILESVHID
jgi:hypothetical protein